MPDELQEQLKATKLHLEIGHGRALKYGSPEEARAYYDAIRDLETAMQRGWDTEKALDLDPDSHLNELRKESQHARLEGPKAATMHDEKMRNIREKYGRNRTLLERILALFS